jgi:hypothetical protein
LKFALSSKSKDLPNIKLNSLPVIASRRKGDFKILPEYIYLIGKRIDLLTIAIELSYWMADMIFWVSSGLWHKL